MPELVGDRLCQAWKKLVAVLVVDPQTARGVPIVVEPVRTGGQPHLLHLRLAREDKLCTARELDRHDSVGGRVVNFVGVEVLEPLGDLAQGRIGPLAKFAVIHGRGLYQAPPRRGSSEREVWNPKTSHCSRRGRRK